MEDKMLTPNDNGLCDTIKYAEITNAKIAYQIYGSGEPLVLCTGYASNMDLWSTALLEMLQKKFQVIVFDYRGMGFSTNSGTSYTIQTLADDLYELLEKLGISKAHLLGWSMGGYVAQMFAIHHPEKISKLVLYATNCGGSLTQDPAPEIVTILTSPTATPSDLLSTLFPDDWLKEHQEPWKFLPEAKELWNYETIAMQYDAVQKWLIPGGGSESNLHKLKMPVLLISGDQDQVVPIKNSSILAGLIPTSTLITIRNCGHGAMYQEPETLGNHILTFLLQRS